MGRTRANSPFSDDNEKKRQELVAAAFELEQKATNSLLYNSQTIDYMVNSIEAGDTNAAWYYWSRLPELRYVSRYISNALSVVTLYAGKEDPSSSGPPTRLPADHPASKILAEFAGGRVGQADLLDRLGLHLTVAGDSVLIGPREGSRSLEPPFTRISLL